MEKSELSNCQMMTADNINLDDVVISDSGCQYKRNITTVDLASNTNQQYNSFEDVPLLNSERQRCEVWSRVMGYYRPTISYNVGKKSEYDDRKCFIEPSFLDNQCEDCITKAA